MYSVFTIDIFQVFAAKCKNIPKTLTPYGNARTMNMNSLVLNNIQNSNYFKYQLYELHTYHQVIEEITRKVGSRVILKTLQNFFNVIRCIFVNFCY